MLINVSLSLSLSNTHSLISPSNSHTFYFESIFRISLKSSSHNLSFGQTNKHTNTQTNYLLEKHTNKQTIFWTNTQTNKHKKTQIRKTYKLTHILSFEQTHKHTHKHTNIQTNKHTNTHTNKYTIYLLDKHTNTCFLV